MSWFGKGPRGRSIVILGPDGAGKSALATSLVDRLGGPERAAHVHLRSRFLPRRTKALGPVTQPHARPPYGPISSIAKVAWLYLDMQAMWRILVPRLQRGGRHIVVERGWWDLVVDPRRFRLRPSRFALRLARTFPPPDLEVVMTGPAALLVDRKPELPIEEIERQSEAWLEARPAAPNVLHLDASRPLTELIEIVMDHPAVAGHVDGVSAAIRTDRRQTDRWVALPPGRSARWYIPKSPRAAARAGLSVYQPMTARASIGWRLARGFAAGGGFRLLPGGPLPDLIATIAEVTPPDATFAIAMGRGPGRANVLVLDRNGRPLALAKIAKDDEARARLRNEASLGLALRHALSAPLSSPSLMATDHDFLLFEAVEWVPRRNAWELPDEVAAAIGRFYRAGHAGSERGNTHGDLAPWNLLRTAQGWSVVDWADASLDGPPFYDVLHHLVQSHALLGRPTRVELVEALHGRGSPASPIAAYANAAGLDPRDVLTHLAEYLDTSERGLQPGPDRRRGVAARAALRNAMGLPPS